jgi:uncharacterized protein (DUF362 family)/NAD-dependent dihydropyrimidine dehydrogenase PreA subunit
MKHVKLYEINSYDDPTIEELITPFIKDHIKDGKKKVLLKPNLLLAAEPDRAVTTHPLFLEKIINSLKSSGIINIFLADSPGSHYIEYERVLRKTGIADICVKNNVNILKLEKYKPRNFNDIYFSSIVDDMDLIINIPKLKTHSLMGLTLGVKNLFGLIPGTNKVRMHRTFPDNNKLALKLYEFSRFLGPKTINLLDGITGMEGEGPSRGNPVNTSLVVLADDAAAMDIATTNILNLPISFCKTNKAAIITDFDEKQISIEKNNLSFKRKIKKPISYGVNLLPSFIRQAFASAIYIKPVIDQKQCSHCKHCYRICPAGAIKIDNNMLTIDKNLCIECFCCYEICEYNAIRLTRSLMHRMFVK